jgi:hypothetical protein
MKVVISLIFLFSIFPLFSEEKIKEFFFKKTPEEVADQKELEPTEHIKDFFIKKDNEKEEQSSDETKQEGHSKIKDFFLKKEP